MKNKKILKWFILGIAIAINVFIIVNAFINGEASAKESNDMAKTTANIINTIKEDTITKENFPKFAFNFRKAVGHFGLFAASGLFSTWSLYLFIGEKKVGYFAYELGMTFALGFLLATLSEFAQKFTEGRTGAWLDVGIDMLGYFLGVLIIMLALLILKSQIFKYKKAKSN